MTSTYQIRNVTLNGREYTVINGDVFVRIVQRMSYGAFRRQQRQVKNPKTIAAVFAA